ncbi:MAG: hypothetical protein HZB91_09810 [Elusimicrobia bacterium]|nr:hypothetical protein [Elusimicrobiota bacterium]
MNDPKVDPNELLKASHEDGELSDAAMAALSVPDLGAQIQAGLGVHPDDVPASEVVLVSMMPDDSGSIRFASNAQAVRDGHNLVLESLAASKQRDGVLVHTRYLNGTVLYPYCALAGAVRMDGKNYDPMGGTPLYDQSVVLLGTVLAKAREFADAGVPARTVTLIITDGADEGSMRSRAKDVAAIVDDMRRAERHIVAGLGVDDTRTDFRAIFREMGIEDRWILTPGAKATDIRRAFAVFSQSAVRASSGAGLFSGTAMGGFATP